MSEKNGRSKNFTPQEKLNFVLQAAHLEGKELGEFLRKNGLYSSEVDIWKQEILECLGSSTSKKRRKKNPLKKENDQLKKEILRKDKALAEASALLILKKKADLLWGDKDEK